MIPEPVINQPEPEPPTESTNSDQPTPQPEPEPEPEPEAKPLSTAVTPTPTIDEKQEYIAELKFWSCICVSLADWTSVYERFAASKKQIDLELASLLEKNYLEEMPGLFAKHERDQIQRQLAMAPKRQSERLSKIAGVREGGSNCDSGGEEVEAGGEPVDDVAARERIARQREERLRLRLLRRGLDSENGNEGSGGAEEDDEGAEEASESDFNTRNYFLMQKVMAKIMGCKYAWPFKNAVLEEDAPDYYNIIQVRSLFVGEWKPAAGWWLSF